MPGKKDHSKRWLVVRCHYTDVSTDPKTYYSDKYEFKFPKDDLKAGLVAKAKSEFIKDYNLAITASQVDTTESTHH